MLALTIHACNQREMEVKYDESKLCCSFVYLLFIDEMYLSKDTAV